MTNLSALQAALSSAMLHGSAVTLAVAGGLCAAATASAAAPTPTMVLCHAQAGTPLTLHPHPPNVQLRRVVEGAWKDAQMMTYELY